MPVTPFFHFSLIRYAPQGLCPCDASPLFVTSRDNPVFTGAGIAMMCSPTRQQKPEAFEEGIKKQNVGDEWASATKPK